MSEKEEKNKEIIGTLGFCQVCFRIRFLSVVHWHDELENKHGVCWSCKDDANVIE